VRHSHRLPLGQVGQVRRVLQVRHQRLASKHPVGGPASVDASTLASTLLTPHPRTPHTRSPPDSASSLPLALTTGTTRVSGTPSELPGILRPGTGLCMPSAPRCADAGLHAFAFPLPGPGPGYGQVSERFRHKNAGKRRGWTAETLRGSESRRHEKASWCEGLVGSLELCEHMGDGNLPHLPHAPSESTSQRWGDQQLSMPWMPGGFSLLVVKCAHHGPLSLPPQMTRGRGAVTGVCVSAHGSMCGSGWVKSVMTMCESGRGLSDFCRDVQSGEG
jgi:hypothetical protein